MINSLEILRSETKMDHKTTEAESFMKDFFSPGITLESYKISLTKLARVLIPIERALDSSPLLQNFPSVQNRLAESMILQDLKNLGSGNLEFKTLPKIETRTELIGVLYVVEGAANGGKIIYKRLSQPDSKLKDCISYFGYQAQSQSDRWAQFKDELLARDLTAAENDSAVVAAKKTFKSFIID